MGHLNPLLAIARHLHGEGHEVAFVTHGPAGPRAAIARAGFPAHEVRSSALSLGFLVLPWFTGYLETYYAFRLFTLGLPHYAREVARVLEEHPADAVVYDFAFRGAALAAEMRGLPSICVYSAGLCLPGPGIPPLGSGLPIGEPWVRRGRLYHGLTERLRRRTDAATARVRSLLGLPPVEALGDLGCASPWLTLLLTAHEIEAPRDEPPPTTFFIGPCFAGRGDDAGFPFEELTGEKKVYVSLGTVFNKKPEVFRRIIAGVCPEAGGGAGRAGTAEVELVISGGGAYDALAARPLPAHVRLYRRVPQVELLPRVDAVVSHGGNNTVNECLAAGKPLLVLPVGGEQGDNASRVVHLGAGLRAELRRARPAEIGEQLRRLLDEPSFAAAALRCAEVLGRTRGVETACRFIARVAETREPVRRPAGYPLTVTSELPPPWEFEATPPGP
jgi:MGT family glycosyltransferase